MAKKDEEVGKDTYVESSEKENGNLVKEMRAGRAKEREGGNQESSLFGAFKADPQTGG